MKKKINGKTVLIFGVSSFLGSNIAEILKKHHRVIGTYYKNEVNIADVLCFPCDIFSKENVKLIIYSFRPDIIVYCIGLNSILDCHLNSNLAEALNTNSLYNITEYSQRYKSKLIYISSAFIFDGEDREFSKIDIPNSNTVYGDTKISSEYFIEKSSIDYLIIRTCKLYGRGSNIYKFNFFEKFQSLIKDEKKVKCDSYINIGFLDVFYLAYIIKLCIDNNIINKILHLSSKDHMTYYDFFNTYCNVFGIDHSMINKHKLYFPITKNNEDSEGNLYYRLDYSDLEIELDVNMPTIKESIEFTKLRFGGGIS